ncbi:MAG: PTS glucose transporter subunit IIA [Acholeplasma sp.]|nr:PTS glucose transporter subunit IIA [Acholeplasma sp.]
MKITVKKPLVGEYKSITETPDQVFAEKMLGDGFVVFPTVGEVRAPFDGQIVTAFPTGHSIGLRSKKGVEVLIHVGIDTVNLKGQGFSLKVKEGDKVKEGALLLEFDLDFISKNAPSIATPFVFIEKTVTLLKEKNDSLQIVIE